MLRLTNKYAIMYVESNMMGKEEQVLIWIDSRKEEVKSGKVKLFSWKWINSF